MDIDIKEIMTRKGSQLFSASLQRTTGLIIYDIKIFPMKEVIGQLFITPAPALTY
ncbi:hypothetical protein [Pseudomonas helvetica]|uniref:hypothetical protein n=1 Tax=Pseudomonas helvetica TaxID=3136738 RepID=UPI00326619A3